MSSYYLYLQPYSLIFTYLDLNLLLIIQSYMHPEPLTITIIIIKYSFIKFNDCRKL